MPTNNEIKRLANIAGSGTASGINSYTVVIPEITSYIIGLRISILFSNANTGSCTININGLGAKSITKQVSSPMVSGDIPAGNVVAMFYDGANFQTLGGTDVLSIINQKINSVAGNYSQSIM